MPSPRSNTPATRDTAEVLERKRQVRGLLWLAIAVIVFAILRTGIHRVFTTSWWRLW